MKLTFIAVFFRAVLRVSVPVFAGLFLAIVKQFLYDCSVNSFCMVVPTNEVTFIVGRFVGLFLGLACLFLRDCF